MGNKLSGKFADVLDRVVRDFWNKHNVPLMLAELPEKLEAQGYDFREDIERDLSLSKAVRYFAKDSVRLIKSDRAAPDHAIVPVDVELSDGELYEALWKKRTERRSQVARKYTASLFAAFAKPLVKSRRCIISLEPFRFRDFEVGEPVQGDLPEVPRNLIQGATESLEADEIASRIALWLDKNQLDPSKYILGSEVGTEQTGFWQQLGRLPDEDLKRISIPLDLVKRIIER